MVFVDTDMIGQGHFPTLEIKNGQKSSLWCIFSLRACWRLSASTECPAASIQHHLIQQLKGKQKLSQPSCWLISKHADVAPVHQFLLLESASDLHERRVLPTRFHANTVTALVASCYLWDSLVSVAVGGLTKLERNVDITVGSESRSDILLVRRWRVRGKTVQLH